MVYFEDVNAAERNGCITSVLTKAGKLSIFAYPLKKKIVGMIKRDLAGRSIGFLCILVVGALPFLPHDNKASEALKAEQCLGCHSHCSQCVKLGPHLCFIGLEPS